MSTISQTIGPVPVPPTRDDPVNFNARADEFLGWFPTLADQINQWATEANALRSDANALRDTTRSYRDDAYSYRNDAQNAESSARSYKLAAETAANRAASVVIPTDTTYGLDALETALGGLLTQIVAQQAQISILKG